MSFLTTTPKKGSRSETLGSPASGAKAVSRIICYDGWALPINTQTHTEPHILCGCGGARASLNNIFSIFLLTWVSDSQVALLLCIISATVCTRGPPPGQLREHEQPPNSLLSDPLPRFSHPRSLVFPPPWEGTLLCS